MATKVFDPESIYTIKCPSGMVLEVGELNRENGGLVRLWEATNGEAQQWQFVGGPDGFYKIVNVYSGKVLDIAMQGLDNGTSIHQWDDVESESQLWNILPIGRGRSRRVKFLSKYADKFLDVVNNDPGTGALVQIWEEASGGAQIWEVIAISSESNPAPKPRKKAKPAPKKKPAAKKATTKKTLARKAPGNKAPADVPLTKPEVIKAPEPQNEAVPAEPAGESTK